MIELADKGKEIERLLLDEIAKQKTLADRHTATQSYASFVGALYCRPQSLVYGMGSETKRTKEGLPLPETI